MQGFDRVTSVNFLRKLIVAVIADGDQAGHVLGGRTTSSSSTAISSSGGGCFSRRLSRCRRPVALVGSPLTSRSFLVAIGLMVSGRVEHTRTGTCRCPLSGLGSSSTCTIPFHIGLGPSRFVHRESLGSARLVRHGLSTKGAARFRDIENGFHGFIGHLFFGVILEFSRWLL